MFIEKCPKTTTTKCIFFTFMNTLYLYKYNKKMVEASGTQGELIDNDEYDWEGDSNMDSYETPALVTKRSSIIPIVISDKNYKIISQDQVFKK